MASIFWTCLSFASVARWSAISSRRRKLPLLISLFRRKIISRAAVVSRNHVRNRRLARHNDAPKTPRHNAGRNM
jgi:hypothetical protein